jgi:hypothetical protein
MEIKHILFIKRVSLDYNSHKHLGKFSSDSYKNIITSGNIKASCGLTTAECWDKAVKQCEERLKMVFDGENTLDLNNDFKFTVSMEDVDDNGLVWDGQVTCNGDYTINEMKKHPF